MKRRREFLKKVSVIPLMSLSTLDLFGSTSRIESDDLYIGENDYVHFHSIRNKLSHIQQYVGYGNFNVISFDSMLNVAKRIPKVGAFSKDEIKFLEFIFYYNPSVHGFFGDRISNNISDEINKKLITKIPGTGHYLFKDKPEETYYEMKKDIGDSLTLTSGIRSIVKQTKLFLDKIHKVDGNITVAAKSIAPPGFTYHAIGDFDVGKKGFGYANFTSKFATTHEFQEIKKLKYVDVRYTVNNKDGVRYEPWHITTI